MNAARHGDDGLLKVSLRARQRVTDDCLTRSLLPAVASGSLSATLLLMQSGANADYDGASALLHAVEVDRVDITAAIILGLRPPSGASLGRALDAAFSVPSATLVARYALIEVLLCGGPTDNALDDALSRTVLLGNKEIIELLLAHNVDINHNDAAAIGHAIQHNRADLVAIMLHDQELKPELASQLVSYIPRTAPSADKVAMLSKLLVNGASGLYCSELLITLVEQDDFETSQLLITYGRGDQSCLPVCSVDYNAARCLQIAVTRNNVPMVQLLALEGAPSKFSLSKAFSSIPPRSSKDSHFVLVQTLLRAGAEGLEVDEALDTAVTSQHRSMRLIGLLASSGANITDHTFIAAVAQGSLDVVKVLLSGNVSASICATAIPVAMKLESPETRFKMMKALIISAVTTAGEVIEISQAVVDLIENTPEDLPLLNLLCREGKANINFDNGLAISQATKQDDPRALNIMLSSGGSLPTAATVERALRCVSELQATDMSRQCKIEALLRRVKPQAGINDVLIKEIKSISEAAHDFSVIQTLLTAGADVDACEGTKEGAPMWWAVTRNITPLVDLILSRRPSPKTLSLALPQAFNFQDPVRYVLCEKLLRAGAVGDEVSKALYKAGKEGLAALPLMQVLLPQADVNYKEGLVVRVVVQHAFSEGLDLLLTPRAVMPSLATRTAAFQDAMKLKEQGTRYQMVERLLKIGVASQAMAEALIIAVNSADTPLSATLAKFGASIEYKGGHSVRIAASSGEKEILKLLVGGETCSKPTLSTLTSGFGGAMTVKERDKELYYGTVQILLEAGMRGEAVDAALVQAVQEGDCDLKFTELLYRSGASTEWHEGEAINIAAQNAFTLSLGLLLEKPPSERVLKRAYRSSLELPRSQRLQVIEAIMKAGKAIDRYVTNTLLSATMENPSDHQLITLLLKHNVFDNGESVIYSARALDLETLTLLVKSPEAIAYLPATFKELMTTDVLWQSYTGLAIVKLMLEKGASGEAVDEALVRAVEKCESGVGGLPIEFLDVLLEFGADVNYQHGLALQRAAMQTDVMLVEKLLPGATSESKAMAMPYVFTCRITALKAIQIFRKSFSDSQPGVDIMFKHPDANLDPMLFLALDKFPRDSQILRALLDMGYHTNQWQLCERDAEIGAEPWPILLWVLEQPEKKISTANIEMLIDEGGKSVPRFFHSISN